MTQHMVWLKLNDANQSGGPLANFQAWREDPITGVLSSARPAGACKPCLKRSTPIGPEVPEDPSRVLLASQCSTPLPVEEGEPDVPWGKRFGSRNDPPSGGETLESSEAGWLLEGPRFRGVDPLLDLTLTISSQCFTGRAAAIDWLASAEGKDWSEGAKGLCLISRQN